MIGRFLCTLGRHRPARRHARRICVRQSRCRHCGMWVVRDGERWIGTGSTGALPPHLQRLERPAPAEPNRGY